MTSDTFYLGDSHVRSITTGSKDCMLFFHGFPGRIDNEDLADVVANSLGIDTFVIHHEGLNKSRGRFRFLNAISTAQTIASKILGFGYTKLHIYGNSWGGAVALHVAASMSQSVGSLILAAPFAFLPDPEQCKQIAINLMAEDPSLGDRFDPDLVPADIAKIKRLYDPEQSAIRVSSSVTVMHGVRDGLLPAHSSEMLAKLFKSPATYLLLDQDHDFSDRVALRSQVLACLNKRYQD